MFRPNYLLPAHYDVYTILRILAADAESYLGIGVQEGTCVRHVVRANPNILLSLCDTWGPEHGGTGRGSPLHVHEILAHERHQSAVQILTGYSQVEIPKLDPGAKFDLIYIDGDHQEEPALDDLLNCWPRCNWAMVVHDVHMFPVWSAVARFLAHGDVKAEQAQVCYCNGGTGSVVIYRRQGL